MPSLIIMDLVNLSVRWKKNFCNVLFSWYDVKRLHLLCLYGEHKMKSKLKQLRRQLKQG